MRVVYKREVKQCTNLCKGICVMQAFITFITEIHIHHCMDNKQSSLYKSANEFLLFCSHLAVNDEAKKSLSLTS